MKQRSITFCTACMGRTHQLKETYLRNIKDNLFHKDVNFVLLNYNSPDDMDDWVEKNLRPYIDEGVVSYLKTSKPKAWSMSITKNITGRNASGDIICWLDADNFTGRFFTKYLRAEFEKDENILCRVRGGRGCSWSSIDTQRLLQRNKGI